MMHVRNSEFLAVSINSLVPSLSKIHCHVKSTQPVNMVLWSQNAYLNFNNILHVTAPLFKAYTKSCNKKKTHQICSLSCDCDFLVFVVHCSFCKDVYEHNTVYNTYFIP